MRDFALEVLYLLNHLGLLTLDSLLAVGEVALLVAE